jgi:curved DNA-binding protein CbpA
MQYFEWFDLPVSLFPDLTQLKQRFLTKSKYYHPDKFTLSTEEEKAKALELSGYNNQAFNILNDLDKRIQYILNEFALLQDDKEPMSNDFLVKMMVFNEAISDLADNPEAFDAIRNDLNDWENELNKELEYCASLFPLNLENAGKLKSYYYKRKYYLRIKNNLSNFATP